MEFFLYQSKGIVFGMIFEKIFQLWSFSVKLWGLKVPILAKLGQLTRDIFRAVNA